MAGLLIGSVRDSGGNLITNSVVTVPGVPITMSSGYYRGWIIVSATYAITASAPGYTPKTVNQNIPNTGTTTVDFVLVP